MYCQAPTVRPNNCYSHTILTDHNSNAAIVPVIIKSLHTIGHRCRGGFFSGRVKFTITWHANKNAESTGLFIDASSILLQVVFLLRDSSV